MAAKDSRTANQLPSCGRLSHGSSKWAGSSVALTALREESPPMSFQESDSLPAV